MAKIKVGDLVILKNWAGYERDCIDKALTDPCVGLVLELGPPDSAGNHMVLLYWRVSGRKKWEFNNNLLVFSQNTE